MLLQSIVLFNLQKGLKAADETPRPLPPPPSLPDCRALNTNNSYLLLLVDTGAHRKKNVNALIRFQLLEMM